jgi:hypothetical protein
LLEKYVENIELIWKDVHFVKKIYNQKIFNGFNIVRNVKRLLGILERLIERLFIQRIRNIWILIDDDI